MRQTKRFDRSRRWLPLVFVVVAGCGPEATKLEGLDRRWYYMAWYGPVGIEETGVQEQREGVVRDHYDFGQLAIVPKGVEGPARGEVFSSETGETYWVSAQAQHMENPNQGFDDRDPKDNNGAGTYLTQEQYYQKILPGASLKVSLTRLFFEGIDGNPDVPPSHRECLVMGRTTVLCEQQIKGSVDFKLEVTNTSTAIKFLLAQGEVQLVGHRAAWDYNVRVDAHSTVRPWNDSLFTFERDVDGEAGMHATLRSNQTIEIPIPLDQVALGDEFEVHVEVSAEAINNRQRESYISAYFRDPIEDAGITVDAEGLKAVPPPANPAPEQPPPSPPPCPMEAPDPAAGTIAFAEAETDTSEEPGSTGEAKVLVTRTGGTAGEVSALVTTGGGTAVAGVDYLPVTTEVRFADGEAGARTVGIPILNDAVQAPDRTVELTLSRPLGCAALGEQTQATLTIFDDDAPPAPPPTGFDVGGTVAGLAGTGLLLRDVVTDRTAMPAGPSFSLGRQYATGQRYDVRLDAQPNDPRQSCTVANGKGMVADHDVTDIQVTCVTVAQPTGLDPTFGEAGVSTAGSAGPVVAMAVQPDGKIVAVTPATLARYTPSGAPDPSFGVGGEAPIPFAGANGQGLGLALQTDGAIVVTGVDEKDDFAVARYTAAGLPDPSFGHGQSVTTDFARSFDRAYAVLIQPDGKLVVAGYASDPAAAGTGTNFALARYTAAGDLDTNFGSGGKVVTDAGGTEMGYAAALQPDGAIVVAGSMSDRRGENADVGLVRYDARGVPDESFGTHGVVRAAFSSFDDQAKAVTIQPDGKIVVAVVAVVGSSTAFAAARFAATGEADLGFGSSGLASASFGAQSASAAGLALQPDGKIVIAGQTLNTGMGDFGVARFSSGGQLDPTFGSSGELTVDFYGDLDAANAIAIQPDGRIVVGGNALDGSHVAVGLVRLLP